MALGKDAIEVGFNGSACGKCETRRGEEIHIPIGLIALAFLGSSDSLNRRRPSCRPRPSMTRHMVGLHHS